MISRCINTEKRSHFNKRKAEDQKVLRSACLMAHGEKVGDGEVAAGELFDLLAPNFPSYM